MLLGASAGATDFSDAETLPEIMNRTMLGFSPLIINHDPLFYGMASVMFFGLGIGSLFTLNYVPALYSVFFRVRVPADNA